MTSGTSTFSLLKVSNADKYAVVKAIFKWVSKVIRVCIGFALLCLVIVKRKEKKIFSTQGHSSKMDGDHVARQLKAKSHKNTISAVWPEPYAYAPSCGDHGVATIDICFVLITGLINNFFLLKKIVLRHCNISRLHEFTWLTLKDLENWKKQRSSRRTG